MEAPLPPVSQGYVQSLADQVYRYSRGSHAYRRRPSAKTLTSWRRRCWRSWIGSGSFQPYSGPGLTPKEEVGRAAEDGMAQGKPALLQGTGRAAGQGATQAGSLRVTARRGRSVSKSAVRTRWSGYAGERQHILRRHCSQLKLSVACNASSGGRARMSTFRLCPPEIASTQLDEGPPPVTTCEFASAG